MISSKLFLFSGALQQENLSVYWGVMVPLHAWQPTGCLHLVRVTPVLGMLLCFITHDATAAAGIALSGWTRLLFQQDGVQSLAFECMAINAAGSQHQQRSQSGPTLALRKESLARTPQPQTGRGATSRQRVARASPSTRDFPESFLKEAWA